MEGPGRKPSENPNFALLEKQGHAISHVHRASLSMAAVINRPTNNKLQCSDPQKRIANLVETTFTRVLP